MLRAATALTLLLSLPVCSSADIPVIYSTDLYHPHDDPDDHYDLACLYALPELDVKAVIIDMANIREKRGNHGVAKKPGLVALRQMGVWLDHVNPDRWVFQMAAGDEAMLLSFSFYHQGPHRLDIVFEDGAELAVPFTVHFPGSPYFSAEFGTVEGNVRVIRTQEPEYTEVMTSVLKNLLVAGGFDSSK